jgi:hypothetical protein
MGRGTRGIKSFARGKYRQGEDMIAINARCLDGIDVQKVNVTFFDGKERR